MKKLLFLLLISVLGSLTVNAQKIKKDEFDKFTKKRIIETSFEKIANDKNAMNKMLGANSGGIHKNVWIAFYQNGDTGFLRLKWSCNDVLALSDKSNIIFLDSDGNTYTFENTSFTVSGKGEGATGFAGSAIYGLDIYAVGNLESLKGKSITDLRIQTTDGYMDFKIDKKSSEKIAKTYELFELTLNSK